MSEYKCPKCGSDNIQKCEIIYMQGTVNHSATTSIGNYEAETTGQASTSLAQEVAPPVQQETHWGAVAILAAITIGFLMDGISLWVIGFAFLTYCAYNTSQEASNYNNNVFPKEYREWQNSYICFRCGNKFRL